MPAAMTRDWERLRTKSTLTVVGQEPHAVGVGVKKQVQGTIPRDIHQGHSRNITGQSRGTVSKGLGGEVLELPLSEISPELALTATPAQEHIHVPIPIDIPQRHSGSIQKHLIRQMPLGRDGVLKTKTGLLRWKQTESWVGSGCREDQSEEPEESPSKS
jgi:hypothetical protein